jgi:hypothetical protein
VTRSLMLSFAALAALAAAASALGSGAEARLTVRPTTAAPGAQIRVTGNAASCPAGSTIIALSHAFPGHAYGEGALSGRVRANHTFSINGHVRRTARPGRYGISARCGGGNLGVSAYLRVN